MYYLSEKALIHYIFLNQMKDMKFTELEEEQESEYDYQRSSYPSNTIFHLSI